MAYCQAKKTVKRLGRKERLRRHKDQLTTQLVLERNVKEALQSELDQSKKDARVWRRCVYLYFRMFIYKRVHECS